MNEVLELEKEVQGVASSISEIQINTQEDYVSTGDILREVKKKLKAVKEIFTPIKSKSWAAHQENLAQEKKLNEPLLEAEKHIKIKMIDWDNEQERLRKIEQDRLDKIAWEEEAAEKKIEADRLIREAEAAEQSGDNQEAEAILHEAEKVESRPIDPVPFVAPKRTPKLSGQSFSYRYSSEVTDLMCLVKAVASGSVSIKAISADQTFLNNQARALKDTMRIPGVRVHKEKTMSSR